MIGRTAALGRLLDLVRGADPSATSLPTAIGLVAGEAGVGKTRLLRELIGSLSEDTVVLAGQADHGSLGRPLDLARSMLGELPTDVDDARAVALDTILARVRGRRAVVVFDDLHWADAESVFVFEALAATALPGTTLLGSYRPDELAPRLPGADMLVRLERRHQVAQVHLAGLSRPEVAALLAAIYGRPLPITVVDALWNRTGGNPFFLEEIVAAAGHVAPEDLASQPLPWSLAEVVSRQLEGLTAEQRRVIEYAAVLGARAPFDVLAALTGDSEGELIAHLRALVGRGLLDEEDDDRFTFHHALVRDAVENQLLARERRRLHEAALAALRTAPAADIADLARHAAGAGRREEMVELARVGVDHYLAIGSTHQALHLAVRALEEAPDDIRLLAGAARAAWLIGVLDDAQAYAEQLLDLTAGTVEDRSAALRLAARLRHELDDVDAMWTAVAELEELVDALPAGEERAAAMAAIAQAHMLHDHPEVAIRWADRAIGEAEAVGAEGVRAQAMVERASALGGLPDQHEAGHRALVEALAEAERVRDWVLVARALNNMSKFVPLGHPDNRVQLEQMRAAGQRAGFDSVIAGFYLHRLAELAAFDGDMAAAHRHLDHAADLATGPKSVAWRHGLRTHLLLEEGRTDAAAAVLATLREGKPTSEPWWPALYRLCLAWRGDEREAAEQALAEIVADGHLLRDTETAADLLDALEASLGVGLPVEYVGEVLAGPAADAFRPLFDAMLAGAAGDHQRVLAALDEGEGPTNTFLPARRRAAARMLRARALAAERRLDEARTQVLLARAELDAWPGWRREEADALLRRLDGAANGDGELSRRELEVAALLAEGLTNAELARRLFISPKTAAVHVSNILMKLGMANRAEVAAWAVRSGLADVSNG
jgi:DNA-binding CsgD family transcriptional regulator